MTDIRNFRALFKFHVSGNETGMYLYIQIKYMYLMIAQPAYYRANNVLRTSRPNVNVNLYGPGES